ncbi:hypothetical protein GCM10010345_29630 [Streptomyces canarius]|uniref:Uncharacterized protein n=1 Tax=Streptomyces canarius TaxID=285453 RepID=A0ABQ3CNY7_9ACTN|nr:hypothetical protein GCM10010345_29630 [Streptomyces canarius]
MQKAALRRGVLAVAAATCWTALGVWDATISEASGSLVNSATRCYATRGNPDDVVCYRNSWKAEYRRGEIVYVPFLIQVPKPSHVLPVILVDSLNDIHPSGTVAA